MIDDEKRALRKVAMERREALARDAGPRHGDELAKIFLDSIPLPEPASRPAGVTVSGFWSMGAEINVIPLLSILYERGYYCGLPVTVKRGLPLVFRHWAPGSALVSASRIAAAYSMAYSGSVHRCGLGLPSSSGKEKS